jgi:hypothetical protein
VSRYRMINQIAKFQGFWWTLVPLCRTLREWLSWIVQSRWKILWFGYFLDFWVRYYRIYRSLLLKDCQPHWNKKLYVICYINANGLCVKLYILSYFYMALFFGRNGKKKILKINKLCKTIKYFIKHFQTSKSFWTLCKIWFNITISTIIR